MTPLTTCTISYAGSTIAIEYLGERAARIVEFVYRYAPTDSSAPPRVVYRIVAPRSFAPLMLWRNGITLCQSDSDAILADTLMGDSCHTLAMYSHGGLLFHAAALMWQGYCLVLPGTIGAGKSTLAAWLVARGFAYLTDELVFVPWGTDIIQAFTRPLNLKHPSCKALQPYFDIRALSESVWSTPFNNLIAPARLGTPTEKVEPTPDMVIFPHYQADGVFSLRPLSKAEAGLELMQCLVNARNLPGHGFSEITRLARTLPAYSLHYTHFEEIGPQIERLLKAL